MFRCRPSFRRGVRHPKMRAERINCRASRAERRVAHALLVVASSYGFIWRLSPNTCGLARTHLHGTPWPWIVFCVLYLADAYPTYLVLTCVTRAGCNNAACLTVFWTSFTLREKRYNAGFMVKFSPILSALIRASEIESVMSPQSRGSCSIFPFQVLFR